MNAIPTIFVAVLLCLLLVPVGTASAARIVPDGGGVTTVSITWNVVLAGGSVNFPSIAVRGGSAIILDLCDFTYNDTSTITDTGGDHFSFIGASAGFDFHTGDTEFSYAYATYNAVTEPFEVVHVLNNGSTTGSIFGTVMVVPFVVGLVQAGPGNGSFGGNTQHSGSINLSANVSLANFVVGMFNAASSSGATPTGVLTPDGRFAVAGGVTIDSPGEALVVSSMSYWNSTINSGTFNFTGNWTGFAYPPVVFTGIVVVFGVSSGNGGGGAVFQPAAWSWVLFLIIPTLVGIVLWKLKRP